MEVQLYGAVCEPGTFKGSLGSGLRTCSVSASCLGMPCVSSVVSPITSEEGCWGHGAGG